MSIAQQPTYKTFDDIPNRAELERVWKLESAAADKLKWGGSINDLTPDEWAALQCMRPDEANKLHYQQRKALEAPEQPTTAAPAPSVELARLKEDERADAAGVDRFFERCQSMATPMWIVDAIREGLDALAGFVGDMNKKNIERNEKLAALEARIAALECKPSLQYRGVWVEVEPYKSGDFVTFDGAVWACKRSNPGAPGKDHDGWQLAVQRGRPGKDGKDLR